MNRYFPRCKGLKKPHFEPYQGLFYGFNQYLGVTVTASPPLPHHHIITPIATVIAFLLYDQHTNSKETAIT